MNANVVFRSGTGTGGVAVQWPFIPYQTILTAHLCTTFRDWNCLWGLEESMFLDYHGDDSLAAGSHADCHYPYTAPASEREWRGLLVSFIRGKPMSCNGHWAIALICHYWIGTTFKRCRRPPLEAYELPSSMRSKSFTEEGWCQRYMLGRRLMSRPWRQRCKNSETRLFHIQTVLLYLVLPSLTLPAEVESIEKSVWAFLHISSHHCLFLLCYSISATLWALSRVCSHCQSSFFLSPSKVTLWEHGQILSCSRGCSRSPQKHSHWKHRCYALLPY